MQKLLTIYLDNQAYKSEKWFTVAQSEKHTLVEEHLEQYLSNGWRVVQMTALGGAAESFYARGWVAVLIEKDDTGE